MSVIAKKLSDSYIHGIAKAMDMQNCISTLQSVQKTTILSAWNNVGNEIFSAMQIQNQSLLKTLNTTNNQLLQTQISKILETTRIMKIQKSETIADKITRIHKMSETLGVARHKSTMISKSETIADKIAKIHERNK